jgi:hypothetical protein
MVGELIDHDSHQWRVSKLKLNFMAPDIDRIMQIPLRHQGSEDWSAWALEKSGQYSADRLIGLLLNPMLNRRWYKQVQCPL